jgi:hypothetical protein
MSTAHLLDNPIDERDSEKMPQRTISHGQIIHYQFDATSAPTS